ncbi:uncharacterized protein LOC143266610 [Megachile rotundata]|uniref:uncharacterized protein LOC143266610 n=1 Tax=Megachile rotundata TaxID=143995 RepID=UPI003FD391C7
MEQIKTSKYPNRTRTKRPNKKQRQGGVRERLRRERRKRREKTSRPQLQPPVEPEPPCPPHSIAATISIQDREPEIIIISSDEEERKTPSPPPEILDTATAIKVAQHNEIPVPILKTFIKHHDEIWGGSAPLELYEWCEQMYQIYNPIE